MTAVGLHTVFKDFSVFQTLGFVCGLVWLVFGLFFGTDDSNRRVSCYCLLLSTQKMNFPHHSLFLATSSAHLEDLAYLDEQQRRVPSRTSLRMPRQNSGSRSQQDHRGKHK